jgi:hypothetical protein
VPFHVIVDAFASQVQSHSGVGVGWQGVQQSGSLFWAVTETVSSKMSLGSVDGHPCHRFGSGSTSVFRSRT